MDHLAVSDNRIIHVITIHTQMSGLPIRVVAMVNVAKNGDVFDWAAYIGVGGAEATAEAGEKLLTAWAAAFFPDLPIDLYRE